jgi:hypothetical protein
MQTLTLPIEFIASPEQIIQIESKTIEDSLVSFIVTSRPQGQVNIQKKTIVLDLLHQQRWDIFFTALLAMDNFTALKVLKFPAPCLSEEKMNEILKKSPFLHTLEISGKEFSYSDQLLKTLGTYCTQLECLDLSDSSKITHQGIQYLKNCSRLRELNISACPNISDSCLEILVPNICNSLETLILYDCPQITDKTIQALHSCCLKLKYLNIGRCEKISPFQIHQLLISSPFLEALFLEHFFIPIEELFQGNIFPQIKKLSLRHTHINNLGFILLSKQAPGLIHLNLSECYLISFPGLVEGLGQLTNLQQLDIRGCLLSEIELKELKIAFPFLTIIGNQFFM